MYLTEVQSSETMCLQVQSVGKYLNSRLMQVTTHRGDDMECFKKIIFLGGGICWEEFKGLGREYEVQVSYIN